MAKQELDRHNRARREARGLAEDDAANQQTTQPTERGEKLKADIDDLLDEIDEVLESNAEDFVRSYVQKGGE